MTPTATATAKLTAFDAAFTRAVRIGRTREPDAIRRSIAEAEGDLARHVETAIQYLKEPIAKNPTMSDIAGLLKVGGNILAANVVRQSRERYESCVARLADLKKELQAAEAVRK